MWSEKFMERALIKGYNILLTGDMRTLADDVKETKYKEFTDTLKFLNNTSSNELIL